MIPALRPGNRSVLPEELDELDALDPRAQRARRDLKRVHAAMRSGVILARAIKHLRLAAPPQRILELGAGDGTLLLHLARAMRPRWTSVELTLLDRLDLLANDTRDAYGKLGWNVRVECADAADWLARRRGPHYDLCLANLFLHHFDAEPLASLLKGAAAACNALVACEPRRSPLAHLGSRLVVFLGANDVTREDAVKSVAAGFTGQELSQAWAGADGDWQVLEYAALPFTHCFIASRTTNDAAWRGPYGS
jgi:SAM-dependent methyltransferase